MDLAISHLSTMRNIMEALEEKVKTHRDKAASRIQASSCQTTGIIVRFTGVYICWTHLLDGICWTAFTRIS